MDEVFATGMQYLVTVDDPSDLHLQFPHTLADASPPLSPHPSSPTAGVVDVSVDNKSQYVHYLVRERLTRGIRRPLLAIVAGVHEIVPAVSDDDVV